MISFLIARLIGFGIPAKLAKPVLAIGAFILILIAVWGAKALYDRSVISKHNAKVEAATAKADRKADAKAAEERRADDARAVTESQEIKEAINEAGSDPIARRNAYYACVRLQQAARRDGKPPADC